MPWDLRCSPTVALGVGPVVDRWPVGAVAIGGVLVEVDSGSGGVSPSVVVAMVVVSGAVPVVVGPAVVVSVAIAVVVVRVVAGVPVARVIRRG